MDSDKAFGDSSWENRIVIMISCISFVIHHVSEFALYSAIKALHFWTFMNQNRFVKKLFKVRLGFLKNEFMFQSFDLAKSN